MRSGDPAVVTSAQRIDLTAAARLLGTQRATLERWVRQGLLRGRPGPDGSISFTRGELEAWARRRGLHLLDRGAERDEPEPDLLADAIARGAYAPRVQAGSAREAIERAVDALDWETRGGLDSGARAGLLERILERERMAGTGLGLGVAVPHPRTPPTGLFTRPTVSLLTLDPPVDWAALDGRPVHAVFLLLSPGAAEHLELLARVARVLRDRGFSELLARGPEHEELLEGLRSIRRDD